MRAGVRLKAIRLLLGLTRDEFTELLGLNSIRLKNIEQYNVRVGEEEFFAVCSNFPELMAWFTYEGDISLEALQTSEEKLMRLIAAKFEASHIPKGFGLEHKIK